MKAAAEIIKQVYVPRYLSLKWDEFEKLFKDKESPKKAREIGRMIHRLRSLRDKEKIIERIGEVKDNQKRAGGSSKLFEFEIEGKEFLDWLENKISSLDQEDDKASREVTGIFRECEVYDRKYRDEVLHEIKKLSKTPFFLKSLREYFHQIAREED